MEQNLSLYYVFHTVAKKGSISHAAKELYISQPISANPFKNWKTI